MHYYLKIYETPFNLPLRVVSNEFETLFVLDDLERLIGLDGMAKQLLDTVLKARFEFPNRFFTRESMLDPLEGYEQRRRKHVLVDRTAAYYILDYSKLDPAVAAGYNDYTKQISTWFYETFGLSKLDYYYYNELKNSIVVPIDDRTGTDFINFVL